jgi:FMN phosphatase YigB (HAD superfamily)
MAEGAETRFDALRPSGYTIAIYRPYQYEKGKTVPANYDVITFDCYGTLIDWERGIVDALADLARAAGVALDVQAALAAYHAIEPAVESETYRPYREVLAETARRTARYRGAGVRGPPARVAALPRHQRRARPHG